MAGLQAADQREMRGPDVMLDSLIKRGVVVEQATELLRAYYAAAGDMWKSRLFDLSIEHSASVSSATSQASSRGSRRSVRKQMFLDQCEALPHEPGYCYLLLVRLPSRKQVRDRLGAYPDTLQVLSIRRDELDNLALPDLEFVTDDQINYHVQRKDKGNAVDVLRRTLDAYKHHGDDMRQLLGNDTGDGSFLPLDAIFGASIGSHTTPMPSLVFDVEKPFIFDSKEHLRVSVKLLEQLVHRRIEMNVVYHWSAMSDIQPTATCEGYVAFCPTNVDARATSKRFRFAGIDMDALLVLPPGVFAIDGDVQVGSSKHCTIVVIDAGSALDIMLDARAMTSGQRLSKVSDRAYSDDDYGVYLDIIRLENTARAMWRASSFHVDKRSVDIRYASAESVFTVFAVPYENLPISLFRGDVVDDVSVHALKNRFRDNHALRVSGKVVFSLDDNRAGRVRLVSDVQYASGFWQPVVLAYVAKLLSEKACITLNVARVQPIMSTFSILGDGIRFSVSGLRFGA